MKLFTEISIEKQRNPIDYNSKVLLLGSCFSENIGMKLDYYKFDVLVNPFGIIFNPVSIGRLVERAINKIYFTSDDLFYLNELWHCFEVHSKFDSSEKENMLNTLNKRVDRLHDYMKQATHIIFTYGTAWVYRNIASDAIVANCHKVPQKKFLKELLAVEAISESIDSCCTLLKDLNKNLQILFTVSPVRHLKDGLPENTRSKSHLITGLHQWVDPRESQYYFPSYEIMMDELRDYRFYANDLLHPNATAIDIIWNRFKSGWVAEETAALQSKIHTIQTGLKHRPFHSSSESHQKFKANLQNKIEEVTSQIPRITFS